MNARAVQIPVWRAYLELTKPRLSALVVLTTAAGYWMAMDKTKPHALLPAVVIGTALVAGGANALNEWMEWKYDALMERTKRRPIPSGRVAPAAAFWFGCIISMLGLGFLAARTPVLSTLLAAISLASYLALYTPLKRISALCTLAGAIPGAIPPMIGWAAARESLGIGAWALFLLMFVWQLPHFLALSQLYRSDYANAGYKMLSVTEPTGEAVARQTLLYGLVLVPVSLLPTMLGFAGQVYFYAALALSAWFLGASIQAALARSVIAARKLFLTSIAYLPLLLLVLVLDKAPADFILQSRFMERSTAAAQLPNFGVVPAFVLADQTGGALRSSQLQGSVWVAGFIFTRCAGQCPMIVNRMKAISGAVEDLQIALISVDPEHDTPQILMTYAKDNGLNKPGWHWLTDSHAASSLSSTRRLSQEGFRLSAVDGGSPQEPITHSVRLVLIDRQLRIRGYYDANHKEAMAKLIQHARLLIEER